MIADANWPPASAGTLTISSEQVTALSARRTSLQRARIKQYLYEVFPEVAPNVPDDELASFLEMSERTGRGIGIRSEAAHKRWAYLLMVSDGQVLRTPGAIQFIRNGPPSPDRQVRIMIDEIAGRVRIRNLEALELQNCGGPGV